MHRLTPQLWLKLLLVLCIGTFSFVLRADDVDEKQIEDLEKRHLVLVEPTEAVKIHSDEEDSPIAAYRERRGNWGALVGVNYSSYQPNNYQPNFAEEGYHDLYGKSSLPMLEFHLQVKRNFSLGSAGIDIGMGTFRNSNSDPTVASCTLNLTLAQVGVSFNFDTLFSQPYAVPYFQAGAYTMIYNETIAGGGQALNGNTAIAPFFTAGVAFQLDWLDPESAATAYKTTPLQSTYLFVEGRDLVTSSGSSDPNLGNSFFYTAGLRAEF